MSPMLPGFEERTASKYCFQFEEVEVLLRICSLLVAVRHCAFVMHALIPVLHPGLHHEGSAFKEATSHTVEESVYFSKLDKDRFSLFCEPVFQFLTACPCSLRLSPGDRGSLAMSVLRAFRD